MAITAVGLYKTATAKTSLTAIAAYPTCKSAAWMTAMRLGFDGGCDERLFKPQTCLRRRINKAQS